MADSHELEINQKARLDLKLDVGAERDSVTVSAVISPLQASDPSVGYRLDFKTVNSLPLDGRSRFLVHESRAVEFRTEFFNLFNHPNFGIPGPYPDFGPFFGKIFSTGQPRRAQFVLRLDF